jgi:CAAX prenyl protease-like protein
MRAIPFALFIGLMAVEPWLGQLLAGLVDARWLYGMRSLVVAGLLVLFWRSFSELQKPGCLRSGEIWQALAVGVAVLAIWVTFDSGFFVLGQSGSGFDPRGADGRLDWALAAMRLAGSALLVPVMEELFWRSLIMRWLEDAEFSAVTPARVGIRALLLSSLAFGLEHSQWFAGALAGLAYGWLYVRTGNLWASVLAHAVTNAALGGWVLSMGAWYFW